MFEWFGENPQDHQALDSAESGFIMFHKTFLTSLIMKSWVTCALDRDCIAPIGSRLGPYEICYQCICHRYDQDALAISLGFFIGQPRKSLPVCGIHNDSHYYHVQRRKGMNYFL